MQLKLGILVLSLPAWLVIGNLSEQAGFTLKKWNGSLSAHFFFREKEKEFPSDNVSGYC